MDNDERFASEGDEGETEAVNEPHRGGVAPTGSRAQPTAWLVGIGVMLVLMLGLLVAWGLGMLDAVGS
jgi:hypothetical protein